MRVELVARKQATTDFSIILFAVSILGLTEERIDGLNNIIKEYFVALDLYQIVAIKRLTKIWFHVDWIFNLMGGELKVEHDKLLKILHKMSNEVIAYVYIAA